MRADSSPSLISGAAQKTDTAEVKGASATCTVAVDLDELACALRDTAADKHSVFVEYKDTAGRSYRFDNHDNANSEKTFVNASMWKGADTSTLQWHVCVNVRWNNDRCSDYVNYTVRANALSFDLDCENADAAACHQLQNLAKDDGWQLSRECAQGALATAVGLAKDGKAAVGRGLLQKVPGVGWVYTAYGVSQAVSDCR